MSRRTTLALACALLLLPVAPAGAEEIAPPGNSGINQYRETIPDLTGGRLTNGPGRPRPGVMNPRTRARLRALGRDGDDAARLAERSVPGPVPTRSSSRPGAATAPGGGPSPGGTASGAQGARHAGGSATSAPGGLPRSDEPNGSALSAAANAVKGEGSGGMGAVFPVLLAVTLLLAVTVLLRRRRPTG